jgi:curli biogenesis system outer membrane secretion channel CsgG
LIRNILKLAGLMYLLTAVGCVATRTQVELPSQRAEKIEFEVVKELEEFRGKIKKGLRVTAGGFRDKTGQHKDSVRARYSRAVTQGGEELLYHMLYRALGPRSVVDRQVDTWNRLTTEYQYSWVSPAGKQRHAGIIKHGGPSGWLVGANYLVTGAVVYANEDRYSGGGGINVDGAGAYFRKVFSRIGIELRLVDMNTSEICWSTLVESWVSGTEVGMDLFRFITAWGDEYLVSAEAGRAQYLPTDHALQVCMATAVVDMIRANAHIFMAGRSDWTEEGVPEASTDQRDQTDQMDQMEQRDQPDQTEGPETEEGAEQRPTRPREAGPATREEEQQQAPGDQGAGAPEEAHENKDSGKNNRGENRNVKEPEQGQAQKPHWLKRPGAVQGY